MTLLQLHEPGDTPLPHAGEARYAIGIDLGTTHSVIAIIQDNTPEILLDTLGEALQPSVVSYLDNTCTVGHSAISDPHAIHSVKRHMGQAANTINTPIGARTSVEISADILRHLKHIAENALSLEIQDAVITVPAYFDDTARTATKDAARLAGLNVLRLVNEPTAAALAYGLDKGVEGIYAIYDLGGGTFDISLLKLENGIFQVLATGGDTQLGGDDIDHAIAEWVANQSHNKDISRALLLAAREAKQLLSTQAIATIIWEEKHYTLTPEQLKTLTEPLVQRTLAITEQAIADADLSMDDVKGVVLVGGSTRLQSVRKAVAGFFAKDVLTDIDPDKVVAIGAARQADALVNGSETLLLDVIPLSLGLETMGGLTEKLIFRNSPIPVSVSQEFTTYQDGQTGMQIHVVQGEREMVTDNRSLARFELKNIPNLPAGIARVKVTFSVDADGILTVEAKEETTGEVQHIEVKPSYGLSEEDMERMLQESMKNAQTDIIERLLVEARTEASRTIEELRSAMSASSALLNDKEIAMLERQIRIVENVSQQDDRDYIDAEVNQLMRLAGPFAERRMNNAVASALKGSHIDETEK